MILLTLTSSDLNMSTQLTEQDIKRNTDALIQASAKGDINEVIRLIPISNPKDYGSYPLRTAAWNGHTECVKRLIPVSNPKAEKSQALQGAAQGGFLDCVTLLLPVSTPKANNSIALQLAAIKGHRDIVKLLIPVSNYRLAVKELLENNKDTTGLQQCIDEYEIQQQKERLTNVLNTVNTQKNNSAKRKI